MEWQAWQEVVLIGGITFAAWWCGRLTAGRVPPWRRQAVAVFILLLAVVLMVGLNYASGYLLPRSALRLALMFGGLGWIAGIMGYHPDK